MILACVRLRLVCFLSSVPPHSTTKTPKPSGPMDVRDHPSIRMLPELCGQSTENRIIGGNETAIYEFPWMALLGYISKDYPETVQYRCGGSLISERYVLTAAHCVTHLGSLELVEVRLGEHDLRTEEDCNPELGCAPPVQDFTIEKLIPHSQYFKEELRNDIALIRLRGKARLSQSVRPICLPVGEEQYKDLVNEKVTVAGWGATENGQGSQVLLKVDLPVMPIKDCAAIYGKSVPVSDKQICAGGKTGRDSCGGDSGGPLQFVGVPASGGLSYIQYGIVSFGPRQCGTAGRPGVYTRVAYFMDWILNNMQR